MMVADINNNTKAKQNTDRVFVLIAICSVTWRVRDWQSVDAVLYGHGSAFGHFNIHLILPSSMRLVANEAHNAVPDARHQTFLQPRSLENHNKLSSLRLTTDPLNCVTTRVQNVRFTVLFGSCHTSQAIIEALESGEIPICDGKSDSFKCHAAASICRLPKLGDFRILKSCSKRYDQDKFKYERHQLTANGAQLSQDAKIGAAREPRAPCSGSSVTGSGAAP